MSEAPTLLIEHAAELLTITPDSPDRIGKIVDGSVLIAGDRIVATGRADEVMADVDRARRPSRYRGDRAR
jgi:imidazolonepropionase-like amidohydrolase